MAFINNKHKINWMKRPQGITANTIKYLPINLIEMGRRHEENFKSLLKDRLVTKWKGIP